MRRWSRARSARPALEREEARARYTLCELLRSGLEVAPGELRQEICRRAGVSPEAASRALFAACRDGISRIELGERPCVRLR